MLVNTKARVGVFAIALGAYLPQFPSLVPEFESQYADFKTRIPDSVELVDGGIVTTKELAMAAGDKFRAADVDLVILQLLTYELYLSFGCAHKYALCSLCKKCRDILEAVYIHKLFACPEFTLFSHIDRDNVVLFLIYACHSLNRRDDRHLMLNASSAIHKRYSCFHFISS